MSDSGFAKITAMVTGIILASWLAVAAPYGDDFMYARTVPDTCEADFWDARGETITSFSDAFGSLAPHWRHVNARAANLFMLLLVPLPRWAAALLLGCASAGWIYLTFVAAGQLAGRPIRKWVIAIASVALWIWFPWSDELVAMDCFVNYVVPSLAAVGFGLCFLSAEHLSWQQITIGCVVALFAGLLHEGFALPLVVGAMVVLLISPRNIRAYPMFIVLCAAAALCSLAPSTLARLGRHDAQHLEALRALLHLWPLYMLGLLAVWGWVTHRFDFLRCNTLANEPCARTFVFWSALAFVALCEAVVLGGRGRVLWPACMAIYVLAIALCERVVLPGRKIISVAVVALMLNVVYGIALVWVQYRFAARQWKVLEQLDADPTAQVGIELPANPTVERLLRGMPRRYTQDSRAAKMIGTGRYGMEWGRVPLMVDTSWGNGDFETWPVVIDDGTLRGSGTIFYSRRSFNYGDVLPSGIRITDRCYAMTASGDTLYRYDITF